MWRVGVGLRLDVGVRAVPKRKILFRQASFARSPIVSSLRAIKRRIVDEMRSRPERHLLIYDSLATLN